MGLSPVVDEYGRLITEGVGAGAVIPPLPVARERSSAWPKFLHQFLLDNPACQGCGRKAVTGHHREPFHLHPELELVRSNIVSVCLPCHFVLCHAGDWRLYVAGVDEVLRNHLTTVLTAKGV